MLDKCQENKMRKKLQKISLTINVMGFKGWEEKFIFNPT